MPVFWTLAAAMAQLRTISSGIFSRYTGVDVEASLLTHAQVLANLQQMKLIL